MKPKSDSSHRRLQILKTPPMCKQVSGNLAGFLVVLGLIAVAAETAHSKPPVMAEVLGASKPGDWRSLDPENTLYVEFTNGRVVIELAPVFAPQHVANVKALAREKYYDGLAIVRAQDNYVVQWADPDAEKPELARKLQRARKTLPAEFDRPLDSKLPFTRLPDGDVYAREVGFSGGFPVARDRRDQDPRRLLAGGSPRGVGGADHHGAEAHQDPRQQGDGAVETGALTLRPAHEVPRACRHLAPGVLERHLHVVPALA